MAAVSTQAKIRAGAREDCGGGGGGGALHLGGAFSDDGGSYGGSGSGFGSDSQAAARKHKRSRGSTPGVAPTGPAHHHPQAAYAGMAQPAAAGAAGSKTVKLMPTRAEQEALALSLLAADD